MSIVEIYILVSWRAPILPCPVPISCYATTIGMSSNIAFRCESKLNISKQIACSFLSLVFLLLLITPGYNFLVSIWGCWTLFVGKALSRQQVLQEVTGSLSQKSLAMQSVFSLSFVPLCDIYEPELDTFWREEGCGIASLKGLEPAKGSCALVRLIQ